MRQEGEREEDSGNSISEGGMQSEALAGVGRSWRRERDGGRREGECILVECSQPLITSAG